MTGRIDQEQAPALSAALCEHPALAEAVITAGAERNDIPPRGEDEH